MVQDTGKKILIAEDDQAILDVVTIILENAGYTIVATSNGDIVLEKMENDTPDLLLLDIWLSGHDGGKIARTLKHKDNTKQIPIIMISANNETEKIAKEVHADGFLQKPFDIDDLLQIVQKYIR